MGQCGPGVHADAGPGGAARAGRGRHSRALRRWIPSESRSAALLEEGRLADVIRRRVDTAAIDVVVARRSHGQRTWHAGGGGRRLLRHGAVQETGGAHARSTCDPDEGFHERRRRRPSGFQVAVRCPYYRGIWASLIEGAELTVDGETFAAESVRWTLGSSRTPRPSSQRATSCAGPFEEPAVLTVEKPGGLEPGLHDARGRRHLAMVVHPGRDAADHEHLDQEAGARPMSRLVRDHPRRLALQLRRRLPRHDVARGLPGGRSRHGRDRHRDPRRHAHRRLPEPFLGMDRPMARPRGRRRASPTCYSSWLDTRLHRDRGLVARRGSRDPPARPRARAPARLLDRAAEARRRLARPHPRSDLARHGRARPAAAPRSSGSGSPRRSTRRRRSDRKIVDDYVDLVRETGTEHFGLLIDTGIFQTGERTGAATATRSTSSATRSPNCGSGSHARCRSRLPSTPPTSRPDAVRRPRPREVLGHDRRPHRPAHPVRRASSTRSSRAASRARSRASTKGRATSTARPTCSAASSRCSGGCSTPPDVPRRPGEAPPSSATRRCRAVQTTRCRRARSSRWVVIVQ